MVEPTDIEKKSLEAHVELCAERYNALETKLNNLESKIADVTVLIGDVKSTLTAMSEKNNDRLIQWGIGVIGFFAAITGYLISHFVVK
jgi:hypothetical protein